MKPALLSATIIAALGGLLFGFDTAVINGTTGEGGWLRDVFGLNESSEGFTVASALIGTIIGSIIVGWPSDKYGRRPVLMVTAVLFLFSAIGTAVPLDWYSFLFFRFLGGIAIGAASVISPLYIAEISPARLRGRLVAVTQFNIVFGILLAFFSNYLIAQMDLGAAEGRWMLGIAAIPAAVFFILLFGTPESPRWLMAQRRSDEARAVLERVGDENAEQTLREIQESLDLAHHSVSDPFFRRAYLKPILLAVAIAAFNQLSGINALMYYGKSIFEMAGAGKNAAMLQAVAIGATNMIFTMLAMLVIDHFGRRVLMLAGSIGYVASLGVCAWAFYTYGPAFTAVTEAAKTGAEVSNDIAASASLGGNIVLISLLVFIASHAFGQGAVIWVFIGEVFPNRARARGQALGSFTHWVMNAGISWTFPIIAGYAGWMAFAFYAAMMVLQLVWVLVIMPETKGVPLEEIQKRLGIE